MLTLLGRVGSIAVILFVVTCPLLPADLLKSPRDGAGAPSPGWGRHPWLNSPPLALEQLKGKVVLVRWWTDRCSLCSETAPALNEFHRLYSGRGLVVIGMYHPKPPRPEAADAVQRAARQLGFEFPIALDNDWSTLRRWWLSSRDRAFTSVTFLIDRQGIRRAIHPGGEFHASRHPAHAACARDYTAIKTEIEQLLAANGLTGDR
jgi:peroxiredoxin